MFGCYNYGPTFGASADVGYHDILISDNALDIPGSSYSLCGATYSVPSGYSAGACGFFAGGSGVTFTPTDVEVFYEIRN